MRLPNRIQLVWIERKVGRFNIYSRISNITNYLEISLNELDISLILFVISQNVLDTSLIVVSISDITN